MTEAAQIPPALVQRQALDQAAARVIWLLSRDGPEPDLDAALTPISALALLGLQELCTRFALEGLERDLFLLASGPELSLEAAGTLAAHPLAVEGRATPVLAEAGLGPEAVDALGPARHLRDAGLVALAVLGFELAFQSDRVAGHDDVADLCRADDAAAVIFQDFKRFGLKGAVPLHTVRHRFRSWMLSNGLLRKTWRAADTGGSTCYVRIIRVPRRV